MKPFFPQAYEALGLVSCQLEDFSQSFKDYETALELLSQKPTLSLVDRKLQNRIIFQQALGIIPKMVSSEDEWIEIRKKFLRNIIHLLHYFPLNALTDSKPVESLGCSSIGYYLIYQGKNLLLLV